MTNSDIVECLEQQIHLLQEGVVGGVRRDWLEKAQQYPVGSEEYEDAVSIGLDAGEVELKYIDRLRVNMWDIYSGKLDFVGVWGMPKLGLRKVPQETINKVLDVALCLGYSRSSSNWTRLRGEERRRRVNATRASR